MTIGRFWRTVHPSPSPRRAPLSSSSPESRAGSTGSRNRHGTENWNPGNRSRALPRSEAHTLAACPVRRCLRSRSRYPAANPLSSTYHQPLPWPPIPKVTKVRLSRAPVCRPRWRKRAPCGRSNRRSPGRSSVLSSARLRDIGCRFGLFRLKTKNAARIQMGGRLGASFRACLEQCRAFPSARPPAALPQVASDAATPPLPERFP